MIITNKSNISLPLAVWLLHDEYDYVDKPNYISVTTLMKPAKQIIMAQRVPRDELVEDLEAFIARKLGTAIHDSIEKAWVKGYAKSLKLLGHGENVIERIAINPSDYEVHSRNDIIPIYMEQREFREIEIDGTIYTVGGKFDMVADGIVQDNKSTSAYSWLYGTRDEDHARQLSLYRWLDAGRSMRRIKEDYGQINYIFTDWAKAQAKSNPKYPSKRVERKDLPLLTLAETEAFVRARLTELKRYGKLPEEQIPECSDADLWRDDPKFKYYADPTKTAGRSTRNFDDAVSARKYMADEKGGKGIIITKPGEVKACGFCGGFAACKQKNQYISTEE